MAQVSAPQLLPVRSYGCGKKFDQNHGLYIVHGFWPETEDFDFGYHWKGHLKRSRTVQISALYRLPVRRYECRKKFDQKIPRLTNSHIEARVNFTTPSPRKVKQPA